MAKRPANGEVSENESTPEHKRARRGTTNGHTQATPDDAPYEDVEEQDAPRGTQATPQTQVQRDLALGDDEAFEAKYRERIQREIEEKGAKRLMKVGEIAEYGIIEKIEMTNFMCHGRTTVNFGPQINFVIGHNGSGKSAVLSAIAIALGGRSASTGRGTGLKSFIKEGQNVAEVIIILKNEGMDAYRPEVYGSSIKITRRFTDKGSSSYTIKGAKDNFKKTISAKREELTNITDHMNLQVDNPVVVLTQDTSRQFLASSKAKDKYQFFLNGTSLTQLSDEYESILESLKKTETILQSKQTVVPDLKRQFTEAQNKYREAQAAKQQHERVTDLEREIAWSHMKIKKAQMQALVTDHETARKNAEKAQGLVEAEETQLTQATQAVNAANEEENAEDSAAGLEERRKTIREEIKAKKSKLLEVKNQKSEMNNALQQANSTIKGLTERIVAEEAKLQDGRRELREKLNLDMERVQRQVKAEEENLNECQANIANLQQLVQARKEEWREISSNRERIRTEIPSIQRNIQRLQDSQKHQINVFGKGLDRALVDISQARWYGQPPVGPLGQYVEVKDPHWIPLMRVNLGTLMASFAVTDQRDREPLSRILQKHGNAHPNIIVAQVDLFDYSDGEPPAHILTPLRVLNIKHEWVVRLLINSAYIERTCITNTRAEAQHLLDTEPRVVNVLSADLMRSQKFSDGGFFTSALRKPRSDDPANWFFTNKDPAESIRLEQERLQALEQEHAAINQKLQETENDGKKSEAKIKESQKLESTVRQKLYKLKDELLRLNEQAEEEAPASVQGLHEARKEEEDRKQSILNQFTAVAEREATFNNELKPLVEQLEEIRKQAEQAEQRNRDNKARLEPLMEKRLVHVKRLEHYRTRLAKATQELEDAAQAEEIVVTEYETWHAEALTISQPIDTDRTPDAINAEMEVLKKALRDRERRSGQSLEEIAEEVRSTQEALDKTQREFAAMKSFNKGLRLAMNIRLDTWHAFRKHISLRTKQQFSYYLGQRGYRGSIDFDHNAHTLNLRVITDEANPFAKDKDPKALSGGEKSFSTICLLMSLWEALGCPIRCLDEFDVFMDQVNRRIAMKAMVQTAKASDKKQYIIITPLDVSSDIASGVRIHKMADPERGQTTLD
ncbi:Structural maintenance of chromosomes protein 6 [Ceratobasidium sp. 394]|nr:Structural maintenance of chromosomes protein 6 [Ceratobasidium sp. 394]